MGEKPPPLTSLTLQIVLEYISPPDNLPIPTYLLSKDLIKRHHYLSIRPENPQEYLSWPSDHPDANTVIPRLHQLSADQHSSPHIRYSSDADSVLAHVHVSGSESNGLRLVFQYECSGEGSEAGAWKYHNAACMPFPKDCHACIPDSAREEKEPELISEEDDDSAYWNAYGNDSDDHEETTRARSKVATPGDSEDAYWAQYAAVQGSGDSTRPSPMNKRKALQRLGGEDPSEAHVHLNHVNGFQPRDPKLQPPSPRELNALLTSLSPPRTFHESLPYEDQLAQYQEDVTVADTPAAANQKVESSDTQLPPTESLLLGSDVNGALKTSVQGLYRLWLSGKPDSPAVREEFLLLVRDSFQT